MLSPRLQNYRYTWPHGDLSQTPGWQVDMPTRRFIRSLPETREELTRDSRWPGFFPSPLCLVTTRDGSKIVLEKVVGASIVNRFPYVLALSFCREGLSERHHVRRVFTEMMESSGSIAVQYLPLGTDLDQVMKAIASIPESETHTRIQHSGLSVHDAITNDSPVFDTSYMVYEAKLVKPGKDFSGNPIYPKPWMDVGSHRVYFLEINAIQLREDIARGETQIKWRALPAWMPQFEIQKPVTSMDGPPDLGGRYKKGYNPNYSFPSAGTIAFEADAFQEGMAIKYLAPLPEDQVEVDNDRARWPCFFPSSAGMITTWSSDGTPNLMPCGSTTVLSRHPLVIAPCVSYAAINVRYAPRATLDNLLRTGRFGCGVPFLNELVVNAMQYAGNVSVKDDRNKITNAGLSIEEHPWAPVLSALPIHFDCEVRGQVKLGTHIMFLGEVKQVRVRLDVTPSNPVEWYPWADVMPVEVKV